MIALQNNNILIITQKKSMKMGLNLLPNIALTIYARGINLMLDVCPLDQYNIKPSHLKHLIRKLLDMDFISFGRCCWVHDGSSLWLALLIKLIGSCPLPSKRMEGKKPGKRNQRSK